VTLQELDLETMLAQIGQAPPTISGSTAALVAAQLGTVMVRMALAVSHKHGSDTDLLIEWLDSILSKIKQATENDRVASTALIETYRENAEPSARSLALTNATREPLACAHLLIELLEALEDAPGNIANSVASDFHGGVELISAALKAVMMAVENNLLRDGAEELRARTSYNRSTLLIRLDAAVTRLQPKKS